MDKNKEYIQILTESLIKKINILDKILSQSVKQREIAKEEKFDDEAFEETMQIKDDLIEQITELDKGFETVYERIRENIVTKPDIYAEELKELKKLVSQVTDRTINVQAEEQRNKNIVLKRFDIIKKEARQVKATNKAVASYYQSMSKLNLIDSQLLDKKK